MERTAATDASVTSTITTNDFATRINGCFATWGLHQDFDGVPNKIEFDLAHKVSLHIGADICGILGSTI